MDWHASVYGSRSGGGQYRDFSDGDADDDGVTYGARGSAATPCFFVRRTC